MENHLHFAPCAAGLLVPEILFGREYSRNGWHTSMIQGSKLWWDQLLVLLSRVCFNFVEEPLSVYSLYCLQIDWANLVKWYMYFWYNNICILGYTIYSKFLSGSGFLVKCLGCDSVLCNLRNTNIARPVLELNIWWIVWENWKVKEKKNFK